MDKVSWWIVCVQKTVIDQPEKHMHITGIGTGDREDWADMRWELDQVLEAMAGGDTFFIWKEEQDPFTTVKAAPCPYCGQMILSEGDTDHLDNLPTCHFDKPESDFIYGGPLFSN